MSKASHSQGLIPMWGKHTVGALYFMNKLSRYMVPTFGKNFLVVWFLFIQSSGFGLMTLPRIFLVRLKIIWNTKQSNVFGYCKNAKLTIISKYLNGFKWLLKFWIYSPNQLGWVLWAFESSFEVQFLILHTWPGISKHPVLKPPPWCNDGSLKSGIWELF